MSQFLKDIPVKHELFENSALTFENCSETKYLNDVCDILARYSWIYAERNTDIFLYDVLEKIPAEWIECLSSLSSEDLSRSPFCSMKGVCPDSLEIFVERCQTLGGLRFPASNWHDSRGSSHYKAKKTSLKKQYEIESMASLIFEVCQESGCYDVLDIGSGLGYLDEILHHNFGLRCTGIDSSAKYTLAAKARLEKDPCINAMNHRTLEITESTESTELKAILKDTNSKCACDCNSNFSKGNQNGSAVLVGLHTCGNLTQDMMKLFCQMEELVAFVCVGCCYNKIRLNDFPMSEAAKAAVCATHTEQSYWSPCVSGLRLAAHGTRAPMGPFVEKSLFYRAVLEYYIKTENISWHHPKRHLRSADVIDFETYCRVMLKEHPLSNDEATLRGLSNLYHQKEHLFPRTKILLILQTLLQPLWEGLVVVDRRMYFKEKSFSTAVIAMWDDARSSRNLALCAYKR